MPRAPRAIEDDHCYHIITRGNDRKRLFRCTEDFTYFTKIIREEASRYPILLYNYCFMNNHVHMLIRSIKADDVSLFFKNVFQRYASYFRKRYYHTGYLFQNRFKDISIDKDSYLLECARYIERNPLRAGIVKNLSDYKWSSYLYYAEGKENDIITENIMYSTLGNSEIERKKRYVGYLNEERAYEHIVDQGLMKG